MSWERLFSHYQDMVFNGNIRGLGPCVEGSNPSILTLGVLSGESGQYVALIGERSPLNGM